MKAILVVVMLVIVGGLYAKTKREGGRAQAIREQRYAIGWPAGDVLASLGEPTRRIQRVNGGESWVYAERGVTIQLSAAGKVSDSAPFSATPLPRQATVEPGRSISYLPGQGYVEHQADVSPMQKSGLGGGFAKDTRAAASPAGALRAGGL